MRYLLAFKNAWPRARNLEAECGRRPWRLQVSEWAQALSLSPNWRCSLAHSFIGVVFVSSLAVLARFCSASRRLTMRRAALLCISARWSAFCFAPQSVAHARESTRVARGGSVFPKRGSNATQKTNSTYSQQCKCSARRCKCTSQPGQRNAFPIQQPQPHRKTSAQTAIAQTDATSDFQCFEYSRL